MTTAALNALVYRMPESRSAFVRMVSFTAAKTSRIFVVSVAWVRLRPHIRICCYCGQDGRDLLWVEIQWHSIDLVKAPEQVFGCAIDVVAA